MQSLQAVDRFLGAVLCVLLQPLRWARVLRRRGDADRSVLLIKFWGLGSLQLMTPAVAALRKRHPDSELVLLTLSQNGPFAAGLGVFDRVETLDVSGPWVPILRRIGRLAWALRRKRFSIVYDFEFFTRFSALITLLTGAPETHGFSSSSVWRGGFHTHTTPFNRYWHVARNFRCLAGGETGQRVEHGDLATYVTSAEERAELELVLAEVGLAADGPLVVLNPNAGSLSLERRWPQDRFARLARSLVLENDARVLLTGAPSEVDWTRAVAALAGELPAERFADLSGRLSIGALQELLERADVFVSNDSGPMHLAAARGTPTLGLFGPETPVMYAPLGERALPIYNPPACSPCINVHDNKVSTCIHGRPECLVNITEELVESEVHAQLRRSELRTCADTGQNHDQAARRS